MRSVTNCPKCGSERISFAHDEAPAWANKWTKCFACGKRWNLDGGPPKHGTEEESTEDQETMTPPKRTGDEIVKLVMDISRSTKPARSIEKEEAVNDSEKKVPRRCKAILKRDGRQCASSPCKNSDFCDRHQETDAAPDVPQVPAKRSTAPITLSEPTIVNAKTRTMDLNGEAMTVLDSFIGKLETDLQVLQAAKEVMERHG